MIVLKNKATGTSIGTLTDTQLQYLLDHLEEENDQDQDYWLNRTQLDLFWEQGVDAALLETLETALGDAEEMEIVWERTN